MFVLRKEKNEALLRRTFGASAFTLIELLLVVALIIILTGVTLRVLNRQGIRNKAEDSVRKAAVQRLGEALETHGAAEGVYPQTLAEATGSIYVESWPSDATYYFESINSGADFKVYVLKASNESEAFVYSSEDGQVVVCALGGGPCSGGTCCLSF